MKVEFARYMYSDGSWGEWFALRNDDARKSLIKNREPGKVQFHTVEMPDEPKPVVKWKNDVSPLVLAIGTISRADEVDRVSDMPFTIGRGGKTTAYGAEVLRDWLTVALETETVYE